MLRKHAVNVLISFILLLSFAFLILTVAEGSMPVEKILDGCVIGGRFFSVYKAVSYTHLTLPTIYSV